MRTETIMMYETGRQLTCIEGGRGGHLGAERIAFPNFLQHVHAGTRRAGVESGGRREHIGGLGIVRDRPRLAVARACGDGGQSIDDMSEYRRGGPARWSRSATGVCVSGRLCRSPLSCVQARP